MNVTNIEDIKQQVAVSPLVKGGSNFETQVLFKRSEHRLEFKPSLGYGIFCSLFALVSFVILGLGIYKYLQLGHLYFLVDNWFMSLWFICWTTGTIFLFRSFFMPIVFDKHLNRFYKGYSKDKTIDSKNNVKLSRIVALQIIGEHVTKDDSAYNSFELNLVLNNAQRLNVIDHGNLKGVIADAETLSSFLNIPIWHATSKESTAI